MKQTPSQGKDNSRIWGNRRDRRQFKSLPYYSPNQFPPPPSLLPEWAPEYRPLEPPAKETK